jgi:DNA repair protein SbcD/Mre11
MSTESYNFPRIGFLTDTHIMGTTPSGRSDDFYSAIMEKLEECGDIWSEHKVDFVIHGGDLFNTHDPSRGVYTDVAKMLRSWNKDVYLLVGSHDYYGYQMKSLRRSGIGSLRASGVIEIFGGGGVDDGISDRLEFRNVRGTRGRIILHGNRHTYWFADAVEELNVAKAPPGGKTDAFLVQVVHGDLVDKSVPWPHILINDVTTDADLVLSGHYHPGWKEPIATKSGAVFYNPGSVARMENTGVRRTPKVCIITIESHDKCSIADVELKSAAEHPFKDKIVAESAVQYDIINILNLMGREDVESIDFKKEIPKVANNLELGNDVIERAFGYIDTLTNKL